MTPQASWGAAFAFKTSFLPQNTITVCGFADSGTTQVDLRLTTAGFLVVTRNGTTLATSSSGLMTNAWYHIEFRCTVGSSTGSYEVRVNGTSVGWVPAASSQNTQATANATANQVFLAVGGTGTQPTLSFDDVIFYDGQTTDAAGNVGMVGPIGDCGLSWLLPTGAGTTTQFTPGAGSNYAQVNQATPDGDTTYVESSTVAQKDTYALADLGGTITTVKAVAAVHYARKTDVGSRQMGAVVRSGVTDYTHPTGIDLGDTYSYSFRAWDQNPNATNWTPGAVNSLELGQIVNS